MFSTSGYFRGVTCPYFVSGLCERPYCHFRHVKPTVRDHNAPKTPNVCDGSAVSEDGASSESPVPGRSGPSSLLSMVGQAIKQVERDIERDRASLSTIKPTSKPPSSGAAVGAGGYVYKPTPISAVSSASASGTGTTSSKKSVLEYDPGRSNSAKYKPTPIRLLKQSQGPKNKKEQNKYVVDTSINVNDNEYDPAVNFSTAGKGQKRYAPRLDQGVESKKSKVEDEPLTVEGVFSDDDDSTPQNAEKENALLSESQKESGKKTESADDKKSDGVFEMDVNAILGISSSSSEKKGKMDKGDQKNNKSNSSKGGHKSSSRRHEDTKEKQKSSKGKHSTQKSDSKLAVKESAKTRSHSDHVNKIEVHEKDDKMDNDRNIFSILKTETVDNIASAVKVEAESGEAKKPSNSDTREGKKNHHSSSSLKSERHKNSSSHSTSSRHRSKHESSSRHRSSSGSSSSSSKHRNSPAHSHHTKNSSSSSKERSSSSRSHSSSRSSSKSKDHKDRHTKDRDKDRHHSKSHSSSSSKDKTTISMEAPSKVPKQISVSNADLFGDDSDESDDVMIVEPPKEKITIVELSSEESDNDSPRNDQINYTKKSEVKKRSLPSTSESEEDSDSGNEAPFASTLNDLSEEQLQSLERSLESEDTYDECLRIFNEESSKAPRNMAQPRAKIQEKEPEEEPMIIIGKKRVARVSEKDVHHSRKPVPKANARPSPAQVMHQRFVAMQKAAEEAAKRNEDVGISSGKSRVAHTVKAASSAERTPTPVGSVAKTITSDPHRRVSHIAKQTSVVKRPSIPADFGGKIPTSVRQRYLNLIIDECLKIYPKEEDAFQRALTEEKAVYGRSTSKNIYLNVAVNCVKRLRAEVLKDSPVKNTNMAKSGKKQFSHEALLGGKMAAKTSFTVKRSGTTYNQPITLSELDIFQRLSHYVLTEDQRRENGYPSLSLEHSGRAVINFDNVSKKVIKTGETNERLCVRCGKRFMVNTEGMYLNDEKCIHHWGKLWKRKIFTADDIITGSIVHLSNVSLQEMDYGNVGNSIERRYTCCSEDANGTGCSIGKAHVHEQNKYSDMKGYMKTMPKSPPPDGNFGVYALDCEMVYTLAGLELARVTVVNSKLEPVYEQLVKPSAELLDPNTRFSGLTEEDFIGVHSTIRDVQAVLLSMFSDCTILVGHSLESDLVALKMIHDTVVDTSVVYPHRLGPPYKRALRNLMADHLNKIIQDDVGGHDSQEDALAAMELMLWKIKEDAKKENRRQ